MLSLPQKQAVETTEQPITRPGSGKMFALTGRISHIPIEYYPDFLVQTMDDSWVMVEIKGEDQLDNTVVQAKKKYAEDMAVHSSFSYLFVPGKKAETLSINSILKL